MKGILMTVYMIGYDLNNKGKNYDGLIDAIKKISGVWCKALESTWFVKTNLTATEILQILRLQIDNDDELLVVKASAPGTWVGLGQKQSDWLKQLL